MASRMRGFSLIELMISLVITMLIGAMVFQLFQQNERVFQDQALVIAAQENARLALAQITDELRMAGQGVPIYSARFDSALQDASEAILAGSDATQIRFRAGITNIFSTVSSPLSFPLSTATTANVADLGRFAAAVGGASGRFVYLSGPTGTVWGWVRAEINSIAPAAGTITVTPQQSGSTGTTFTGSPVIGLEEAVAFRLVGTDLVRSTSTTFTDPANPTWTDTTLATGLTQLQFVYYDQNDNAVVPNTLANRALIRRIDVQVTAQTSEPISNGSQPTYAVSARVYPRNLGVR